MPLVSAMHLSFVKDLVMGKNFVGSIMIRGHDKTAETIKKMKRKLFENANIDMDLQPTGNGWTFIINGGALFYGLEESKALEELPLMHRALTASCAAYALMGNDYIPPIAGCQYADLLRVFKSIEFKKLCRHDIFASSPVKNIRNFSEMSLPDNPFSLNLQGALIALTIMFQDRRKTRSQFELKYPSHSGEALPFMMTLGTNYYNVVRACSILAGEEFPAPDSIALLARISCASFVLRQWCTNPYEDIPTPHVNNSELNSSPYRLSRKRDGECRIEYTLQHIADKSLIRIARTNNESACEWSDLFRERIVQKAFGSICDKSQTDASAVWPFSVYNDVRLSILNKGLPHTCHVKAEFLLSQWEAKDEIELQALVDKYDTSDPQDFFKAAKTLENIFVHTLTSNTAFNRAGNGRPLLTSNSPIEVSKGGYNEKWDELQTWPENSDEWMNTKMANILTFLGSPNHKRAVQFLLELTKHVLKKGRDDNLDKDRDDDNPDNDNDDDTIDLLHESDEESDDEDEDNGNGDDDSDNEDGIGNEEGTEINESSDDED